MIIAATSQAMRPAPLATILFVAIGLFFTPPLVAEEDPELATFKESTLTIDDPVHVGDEVIYTVEIEHVSGVQLHISSPPDGSRWRELSREISVDETEGVAVTTASLRYAVYRPGPTRGPPISATLVGRESDQSATLEFPQHPLEVVALTDENASLGDPRSPRPIWNERPLLTILGGGGLALCLLAMLALFVIRRRGLDDAPEVVAPPEDVALEALQALKESELLDEEEWKRFYLRLSEIIRRYLGRRWSFPGTEWTTTEIMAKLHTIDDPDFGIEAETVGDWMRSCDRVKFAGYIPTREEAEARLAQAFDIVEATLPTPEPEDDEENPGEKNNKEEAAP